MTHHPYHLHSNSDNKSICSCKKKGSIREDQVLCWVRGASRSNMRDFDWWCLFFCPKSYAYSIFTEFVCSHCDFSLLFFFVINHVYKNHQVLLCCNHSYADHTCWLHASWESSVASQQLATVEHRDCKSHARNLWSKWRDRVCTVVTGRHHLYKVHTPLSLPCRSVHRYYHHGHSQWNWPERSVRTKNDRIDRYSYYSLHTVGIPCVPVRCLQMERIVYWHERNQTLPWPALMISVGIRKGSGVGGSREQRWG